MEYPKALYLAGQMLVVENASQEDDAREDGYTDWQADAARNEAAQEADEPEQADQAADVDLLRETEHRLNELEHQLNEREQQLFERESQVIAREDAVAAAEAALAEKQAAAEVETPPADTGAEQPLDREALKARATELGIQYANNIKTEKLAELIAAHNA